MAEKSRNESDAAITEAALMITLTEDQKAELQNCISTNGRVQIQFTEIQASQLPELVKVGTNID